MNIALVTQFFSQGMGYTENMLPKALTELGHEVHVFSSTLQVYGNQKDYKRNYEAFLGPAEVEAGQCAIDGFRLHRMPWFSFGGYIGLRGLSSALADLRPEIVQFNAAASIDTLKILLSPWPLPWSAFTECHQHASISWPMKAKSNFNGLARQAVYRLTRTYPSIAAHRRVKCCFAISPDCVEVANRLYGVPKEKLVLLPLGTDTSMFRPCVNTETSEARNRHRLELGFDANDIVCIYTGRFSAFKNPALLASAVEDLRRKGRPFRAIFVGSGEQENVLRHSPGCIVRGFVKHADLASLYRVADIAVWPCEESMSMLDAAASGLPLVANDKMGDLKRIDGNGRLFRAGSTSSLAEALASLQETAVRRELSAVSRAKAVRDYSWRKHAEKRCLHYAKARFGFPGQDTLKRAPL